VLLEIGVGCCRWALRLRFGSQCVYIFVLGRVSLWGFGGAWWWCVCRCGWWRYGVGWWFGGGLIGRVFRLGSFLGVGVLVGWPVMIGGDVTWQCILGVGVRGGCAVDGMRLLLGGDMSMGVLGATKVCVGGEVAMRGEVLIICQLCGIGGEGERVFWAGGV